MLTVAPRYHKAMIKDGANATYSCFLIHQKEECWCMLNDKAGVEPIIFIYPITHPFKKNWPIIFGRSIIDILNMNEEDTDWKDCNIILYGYDIIDDKHINQLIHMISGI